METAIIGMQKNEKELLPLWCMYYGSIFGFKNLHLLDNGSDCSSTIATIEAFRDFGVNIYQYPNRDAFEQKGDICLDLARTLMNRGIQGAYFSDIDELLMINDNEKPLFNAAGIKNAIANCLTSVNGLHRIGIGWTNIPNTTNVIVDRFGTKKILINQHAPDEFKLDVGFHAWDWGKNSELTTYGPINPTPLGILHFHNKPHRRYIESAKEKLKSRVSSFDNEVLRNYTGPGSHLIYKLLMTEEEYNRSFFDQIPASIDVSEIFRCIGLRYPFI